MVSDAKEADLTMTAGDVMEIALRPLHPRLKAKHCIPNRRGMERVKSKAAQDASFVQGCCMRVAHVCLQSPDLRGPGTLMTVLCMPLTIETVS